MQERRDIGHLLWVHAVAHGVAVPLHGVTQRGEQLARGLAARREHHRVLCSVGHENGRVRVGGVALCGQGVGQRQVARQRHDTRQRVRQAQAGVQRHGAALRKTGQHDVAVVNAARHLMRHQRADGPGRVANASGVLTAHQVGAQNVVPGGHDIAAIDGDRHLRRVRKHKADGRTAAQVQLGHQGGKVVAVGTQTVQPDHCRRGVGGAFYFNAGQQGGGRRRGGGGRCHG